MNERSITMAEKALMDFIRKSQNERDYFSGRLIEADDLPAPKQQMVSAAVKKVTWYKVEISDLEGELEMLREEFGIEEDTGQKEGLGGKDKKDKKYDAGRA